MKVGKWMVLFLGGITLGVGSMGQTAQARYGTLENDTYEIQNYTTYDGGITKTGVLLKEKNGDVWKLLPEKKKVAENVSEILCMNNIWDEKAQDYTTSWFTLGKDGTLYRNKEKIKDNVEEFTISGDREQYYLEILTYNDELWESGVLEGGSDKTPLTKTDDHVKDIPAKGELSTEYLYLAGNGDLKSYPRLKENLGEEKVFESNVKALYEGEVVRGADYQTSLWRFGFYNAENSLGYFDRGKSATKTLSTKNLDIQSIGIRCLNYDADGEADIEDEVFLFTKDHEIWKGYVDEDNQTEYKKIADNVQECFWEAEVYQTINGVYYTLDGEKLKNPSTESPVVLYREEDLSSGDVYEILTIGSDEGYILQKNGKTIFSGLATNELLLTSSVGGDSVPVVICKDQTIWEVSDTPEKIFDFNEGMLGDIDEDGKVGMKDARTALKAAVGSETLTNKQQILADVDKDGKVGMKDARLILKYAVGSIQEF